MTPDRGTFLPTSFSELLQRAIVLPGLDPSWEHTLIDIAVAEDGGSAELTMSSSPPEVPGMVGGLRLTHGSPTAAIRVYDGAGVLLSEGRYPAPLREGQEIAVGDVHYRVVSTAWPGRDPATGACLGAVDWQHVVVGDPLPATSGEPAAGDPEGRSA
ncbi:hypothetical protein [Saccharothrix hoggarensis]